MTRLPPLRFRQFALAFTATLLSATADAQVDFGDDTSQWANDGECDDPRFSGEGAADTLLEEDRARDATDCRSLYAAGRIVLRESASAGSEAIDFGDDASQWANDGECDDPRFAGAGAASTLLAADLFHDATDCRTLFDAGKIELATAAADARGRVERGRLSRRDDRLSSGELADRYAFVGEAGTRAIVDLRSSDFDPYLIVRAPSGAQFDNDDYEGDPDRSLLSLDLAEDGNYDVTVTSYGKGETGAYTLEISLGAAATALSLDRSGTLESGDRTLESGEYVDSYEFAGTPGQRVSIDLLSADFDTYLILVSPDGNQVENDDAESDDDLGHSLLVHDLDESGIYRVLVTSYEPGETGDYRLTVQPATGGSTDTPAERDVITITAGRPASGRLATGDALLDDGELHDVYVFDGTAGDAVRVELQSGDFDTYLGIITPSNETIENDDFDGSIERSVVELTLPESGRYRVIATSYAAAETGTYSLTLGAGTPAAAQRSSGRVFGIFAGIGDYPGEDSDLAYTADDAVRIREALVRGGGMRADDAYTLLDATATIANLRAAFDSVAAQIGPDDTFVLFFSGHGDRVARSGGFDSTDPDGLDETIELYDGALRDDDVRALFDRIQARTALILLDSCYSGGFAKDVISAPGRMGMFSSEEDVTSQVAAKFRAGGFLSVFLDEAIAAGAADADGSGGVTAIELSQYVHERYRSDVKASAAVVVRTQGPQSGYQHLVVDRGSIGPYDVLFAP